MSEQRVSVRRLQKADKWTCVGLYFVTLAYLLLMALRLNNPPVLDEVGTMANTALLNGWDWTECVKADGNHYYKYGLAILYLPAFKLFSDTPVMIYKAVMFINEILMSFVPVFAFVIFKKHLYPAAREGATYSVFYDRILPVLISFSAGMFPSVALTTLYAKGDIMLMLIPWPVTLLVLDAIDMQRAGRKKTVIWYSVLAGFLSVYAFMSHSRGIVMVIAVIMANLFIYLITKKKVFSWIPFLLSTGVFLFVDRYADRFFKSHVNIYGTDHASVESFDFAALKLIFTKSGMLSMIKLVIGWAYELITSTYGMAIIGVMIMLYYIVKAIWKKKFYRDGMAVPDKETAMSVYCLLLFLGSFAMGCLFFFKVAHNYFINVSVSRSDRLMYERYLVCTVGPMLLLTFYVLMYRRNLFRARSKAIATAIFAAVTALFFIKVFPYIEGVVGNSRYYISICTFVHYSEWGMTSEAIIGLGRALKLASLLAFCIYVLIMILSLDYESRFKKNPMWTTVVMAGIIFVYCLSITQINYYKTRLSRDELLMQRISEPVSFLWNMELKENISSEFPYVLKLATASEVKHYQFSFPTFVVGTYRTKSAEATDAFVIALKDDYREYYYNDDYYLFDDFDYAGATCDVIYVKGDRLAEKMNSLGYSMTKYNGALTDLGNK